LAPDQYLVIILLYAITLVIVKYFTKVIEMTDKPQSSSNPIHILIADDHELILDGMISIISADPDCEVVAKAVDGKQALDLFNKYLPDITILDLVMPKLSGIEVIRQIRANDPKASIIALSAHNSEEHIYQAIQAGATAYVLKENLSSILIHTIHAIHKGEYTISADIAMKYIQRSTKPSLSEREVEILQLVAEGNSNAMIASKLSLTEGTVKVHIYNIMKKLEVTDRTAAVVAGIKRGFIKL
jgi:two-component system, NarL family, response regulator